MTPQSQQKYSNILEKVKKRDPLIYTVIIWNKNEPNINNLKWFKTIKEAVKYVIDYIDELDDLDKVDKVDKVDINILTDHNESILLTRTQIDEILTIENTR